MVNGDNQKGRGGVFTSRPFLFLLSCYSRGQNQFKEPVMTDYNPTNLQGPPAMAEETLDAEDGIPHPVIILLLGLVFAAVALRDGTKKIFKSA